MDGEDMRSKPWVASMGIYVFKKKVLQELLSGELGSQVRGLCVRGATGYMWKCVGGGGGGDAYLA